MNRRRIVVVGAGGHGRETFATIQALASTFDFAGFIDDGEIDEHQLRELGARCLGDVDHLLRDESLLDACFTIGIGSIQHRRRVADRLRGRVAAVLVHPSATVGPASELAAGVIVAPGAHITTNVTIGEHTHLNTGCVVAHDCVIDAFVSLSPGVALSGAVTIGRNTFVGTGATVLPGRVIGANVVVGAGAVVTADVPDGATVKGVPAR